MWDAWRLGKDSLSLSFSCSVQSDEDAAFVTAYGIDTVVFRTGEALSDNGRGVMPPCRHQIHESHIQDKGVRAL